MTIFYMVLVLGFLIFIHELGHFLVAKHLDIKVTRFAIGFGPKIWGFTRGETEYALCAIPLGGYVKMVGEEGVADPDCAPERMFSNKRPAQRIALAAAGPLANIALAFILFIVVNMLGLPSINNVVGEVIPGGPAAQSGMIKGDRILAVGDTPVKTWKEFSAAIDKHHSKTAVSLPTLTLKVQRGEGAGELFVTPVVKDTKTMFGEPTKALFIGIKGSGEKELIKLAPAPAVAKAVDQTVEVGGIIIISLVKMFQGVVPVSDLGGPVMVFQTGAQYMSIGLSVGLFFVAFFSLNLGILNLLPIPVLDGGHIAMDLIEIIARRPLSVRVKTFCFKVGGFALLALMLVALFNDGVRLVKSFW